VPEARQWKLTCDRVARVGVDELEVGDPFSDGFVDGVSGAWYWGE
jgi:tryptophan synthase alpha subunit